MVDQSFYAALENRALLQVAEETVKARQFLVDQVQALTNAKLKSDVDLAFAKVDFARANLLLLDAQDNYQASLSTLSAILGYPDRQEFTPVGPGVMVTPPAPDAAPLIQQALDLRPEVRSLRDEVEAAEKFARAEHDLWWPTVQGMGRGGRSAGARSEHYQLVRRSRGECEHPGVQRIPVQRASKERGPGDAGAAEETAGLAEQRGKRCAE